METRGWKLCICFGLLSVALAEDVSQPAPGAREDESDFTRFTLVSDYRSHLFSSCVAELNTVEATLHAIEVDEGKAFIRYIIDSDREMTWEDVEGEHDTIACAFKAYEAEALMFKDSNGVCSLSINGSYNPNHASCDGEEVFIFDPLNLCSTSLGEEAPGYQYYSWLCETNCGRNGRLFDEVGDHVNTVLIPDEIAKCCPTATSPCLYPLKVFYLPCILDRHCYFLGMVLPSAAPGQYYDQLMETISTENKGNKYMVNVRYVNGNWYHFPGEIMVDSSEWDSTVEIPTTEGFVALNDDGKLEPLDAASSAFAFCQAQDELPECAK